jgi:glycosyltransferase involved in cell wall biosynthesis
MTLSATPRPTTGQGSASPTRLAARNFPLISSVGRTHLGRPGSKATSVVLRRCPRPLRTLVGGPAVRAVRPELSALALAADGRQGEARAVLEDVVQSLGRPELAGSGRAATHRLRVAHAAVVLHDLPLAQQALAGETSLVDSMESGRSSGHREALAVTRSLVAAEQGNLDEALDHLDGLEGAAARNLRERLTGERQVLRAQLLITSLVEPPAPRPVQRPPKVASVLHVVSGALPEQQTGYTIRTQGIAAGQRAAGLDAQVVTRLGFPVDIGVLGAAGRADVEGVPYHRLLPSRSVPVPGTARQQVAVAEVEALIRQVKPDVLHAHSKHENAQVALVAGRRLGIPVVYEARGFLEQTWLSSGGERHTDFYRWSREAETRCMQQAQQVITLSTAMAHDIVARGLSAQRVHIVPNAVPEGFARRPDGDAGEQRARAREGIRRRHGIPLGHTVFGTVSTVNAYEGLECVVEALGLLADSRLHVMVVGDGPARQALEHRAHEVGVSERVHFAGRVSHREVRDHLDAMDVFVVPRRATEVTRLVPPLKPLEAMAVGVPVLVSDLAPLVEIAEQGRFGRVAPAGDADRWARAMSELAQDPFRRAETGARAAEFVRRERTWEAMAARYARIYAEAAGAE